MFAAVLTLTRDRLSYTQHCFQTLRELAGCDFHHYVLDQDSKDGTNTWLERQLNDSKLFYVHHAGFNMGIAQGMNHLVEKAMRHGGYDAIVKFDNDCELVQNFTLSRACTAATDLKGIVSPIVDGLNDPPRQIGRKLDTSVGPVKMMETVGGVFMATTPDLWVHFRYPEDLQLWGGDDTFLCQYARNNGMPVGYLEGCRVNHYRTTDGQHHDFPSYFLRRQGEGGPP